MSLSVLLDYRPEDSKEHSFEVSLFAELFNEMLTRDFGFNIYKTLHLLPPKKEDEPKKESATEDAKEEDEKKVNGDGGKEKEKGTEENAKAKDDKDDKEKERARERDRDSRKKSRFDDAPEKDRRRKEKEEERDRLKYYTADRDLLLSFAYFDISHCGYIFDKDVEDLFYTLGLNLSRSQIRRLVSKAVTRDSLYYRKLTDKVKETPEENKESKDKDTEQKDPVAEITEVTEVAPVKAEKNDAEEITEAELEVLATGNRNIVEQMKINLQAVLQYEAVEEGDDPPAKKIKLEPLRDDSDIPETNNGLVLHHGGVLDIPKLLEQMRHTEKAREDTEQLLIDLRRQNSDLTKSNNRSNERIKDQSADIKSLTRKLVEAEQNLRELTKKSNEYFSTLSSVYDRVSVVMQRSESKRSSSITSSRRGSSRDRASRKDAKSKDKEPEPQKEPADKPKAEEPKKSDEPTTVVETVTAVSSKESIDSKKSENAKTDDTKPAEQKPDEKKKE